VAVGSIDGAFAACARLTDAWVGWLEVLSEGASS
jgi:hypothetical protein